MYLILHVITNFSANTGIKDNNFYLLLKNSEFLFSVEEFSSLTTYKKKNLNFIPKHVRILFVLFFVRIQTVSILT